MMISDHFYISRRRFINHLSIAAAAIATPGVFADELIRTPAQTEGPFYPDTLPLDTDNDLIVVNDALSHAIGEITHLTGRVLDLNGNPVRNAVVEIWQVDNNGRYIHSGSRGPRGEGGDRLERDGNFQGFGRFLTGKTGEYYFRTIKPRPYPGRAPHIHFRIDAPEADRLTTQCYVKGEPQNERDGVLRSVRDEKQKQSVIVDFTPIEDSALGELQAAFDIVLGYTPEA